MNIVAIDVDGTHNAVSTSEGKTYIFQTDAMSAPEFGERIHVPSADPKRQRAGGTIPPARSRD